MVLSLSSISFKPGSSNFVFFYWSALVYDFVAVSSPGKYLPHSWPCFVPHTWIGSTYVTRVCGPEGTRAQEKPDDCYAPELLPTRRIICTLSSWSWGGGWLVLGSVPLIGNVSLLVWSCLHGIPEAVDILSLVTLLCCRCGFIFWVHFQGLPWFQFIVTSVESEDQLLENY